MESIVKVKATPAVTTLKRYARILQRRCQHGEPQAVSALRVLREFADTEPSRVPELVRRSHCLTVSALQVGFRSWPHALGTLENGEIDDFGTLLYPSTCYGHWNIWSAHYDEASSIRGQHGGYLLAYRRQFLIVERDYIDSLGLDPEDPAWSAMARDWVKPRDPAARSGLYEKLVHNALVRATLARD
jgi:hypothetical protein